MRSNRVTTTELTHVKRINKYLLFRPHISVEYNNISKPTQGVIILERKQRPFIMDT